jgi:transcriptional regulator with XRE-family HTH domain
MDNKLFAKRFESRRVTCGFKSKVALAEEWDRRYKADNESGGTILPTLKKWASGTTAPSVENLERCAEILDCDIDYLLFPNREGIPRKSTFEISSETGLSQQAVKWLQVQKTGLGPSWMIDFVNALLKYEESVYSLGQLDSSIMGHIYNAVKALEVSRKENTRRPELELVSLEDPLLEIYTQRVEAENKGLVLLDAGEALAFQKEAAARLFRNFLDGFIADCANEGELNNGATKK